MLYLLSGKKLKILVPLMKKDSLSYPVALSILSGVFGGWALADNKNTPLKAILFHSHIGYMHYLGEKPNTEESAEFTKAAINYTSDREYCNWVEFAHCPNSIKQKIIMKFPKMKSFNRISWNHSPAFLNNAPKPSVPDGCKISIIEKRDFKIEFIKYEVELFWNSIDDFLENAFGILALDAKGNFLGICSSVSTSDNFFEINIEVNENHRREGIGYAIAHRYIEECYKHGKDPHWDCNAGNIPSRTLAKKLGFNETGRYPLVSWVYDSAKKS